MILPAGSKIDTAHHASRGGQALIETLMFSEAVETAVNATSEEDTLIIVTADHSHVMAMGGYSARGHHILGRLQYILFHNDPGCIKLGCIKYFHLLIVITFINNKTIINNIILINNSTHLANLDGRIQVFVLRSN